MMELPLLAALATNTSLLLNVNFLTDALLCYAIYEFLKWLARPLWARHPLADIPGPEAASWFSGNLGQLFNPKGLPFHLELGKKFGGIATVWGFLWDRQLYISDPHALHSILVREQDAFEETRVFTETNKIIFGPGLVATEGDHHRRQRRILNPIFSSAQIRGLEPVFWNISEKLVAVLKRETSAGDEGVVLDMSEWMSRAALECVGQGLLGWSFDPLDTKQSNPYTNAIKEIIPTIFSLSLVRQLFPVLTRLGPASFRRKIVELIPHQAVQKLKHISDTMHRSASDILDIKRGAPSSSHLPFSGHEVAGRDGAKDLISVLLRENDLATRNGAVEVLDDDELTGQITVMIFGAQDTTSSMLSRVLHQLALFPEVQERLRAEISGAVEGISADRSGTPSQSIPWSTLDSLSILDSVIKETLRLYPPVPFVRRTAIKDTSIPYQKFSPGPSATGSSQISSANIPSGTTVFLGIAAANRLPEVWGSDAEEFKIERWLSGSGKSGPPKALPGIFAGMMSFLGGRRACIGYRFALMEMKIILAAMVSNFIFSVPVQEEVEIVWNLSQIIAPAVRTHTASGHSTLIEDKKGLPLLVRRVEMPCGDI